MISHNIHSGALKLDGRDAFHFTASAVMAAVGGNGAVQIELVSLCPAFHGAAREDACREKLKMVGTPRTPVHSF